MTADRSFPPIASLVPQSGPMCLLDRVLEHEPHRTVCVVDPARSAALARPDGLVPAYVGLEYMAQCIAAHGGLVARSRGEPPRAGLFLGARRVSFAVEAFRGGRALWVEVCHHRGEHGLVAFDCALREAAGPSLAGEPPLVEGRLNVYLVESWKELDAGADDAD